MPNRACNPCLFPGILRFLCSAATELLRLDCRPPRLFKATPFPSPKKGTDREARREGREYQGQKFLSHLLGEGEKEYLLYYLCYFSHAWSGKAALLLRLVVLNLSETRAFLFSLKLTEQGNEGLFSLFTFNTDARFSHRDSARLPTGDIERAPFLLPGPFFGPSFSFPLPPLPVSPDS